MAKNHTLAGVLTLVLMSGIVLAAIYGTNPTIIGGYKPRTRTYYIAAENVIWDYAPTGKDPMTGEPVPSPYGDQTKYNKVRYIEYTDDTFTVKKSQPVWLGILGPIIRGVEGDTIKVVFYNKANKPYSIHAHGVLYDKDNEGALMGTVPPATKTDGQMASNTPESMKGAGMPMAKFNSQLTGKGSAVMPGQKYTYTWFVSEQSVPQKNEGGSKVWWYHSHVDPTQDIYDGLVGPIIITSAKYAREDGTPKDVDKEFVTMFMIFDESSTTPKMNMGDASMTMSMTKTSTSSDEGNFKHAINGYIFNNLPGLIMNRGDKVRWYELGMGTEADIHSPHWHGDTVLDRATNVYTDVTELLPGSMKTFDMLADNPGTWMFHCHVADHIRAGMLSVFKILP